MGNLNPPPSDDGETNEAPIIIAEGNQQAKMLLRRALSPMVKKENDLKFYKNIFETLAEVKNLLSREAGVSIVISDIFYNDENNIFTLIKEMESTPALWNTGLVLYTNESTPEMFSRISKGIKHIPFQMVSKTNDAKRIEKICRALLDYRVGNRYFLEIYTSLETYLKLGKSSLLGIILKKIDEYAKKYPKVFKSAKVGLLKGKAYFGFWKKKSEEVEAYVTELEKYSPTDANFEKISEELDTAIKDADDLITEAEKYLLESYDAFPKYWPVISALYWLYMEKQQPKEAKRYLSKLIELFPQQTEYSFQMGKLIELEGDFSGAIQHYFDAERNAWEERITEYDVKEAMQVIDKTLAVTNKIMKKIGISQLSTEGSEVGSEHFISLNMLQQVNAQTRVVMEEIAKKHPAKASLFNKIGITYRRTGNYKMASEMYEKAINKKPNDHRIRINYAVLLGLRGSWNLAELEIKKAIEMETEGEDRELLAAIHHLISNKDIEKIKRILV